MFDATATTLFPLPLTAFEKYMFLDDRPDYPMDFALQLRLTGDIARPAFDSSFAEALARHPLLCALIRHTPRRGMVWNPARERRPVIDWARNGTPLDGSHDGRIDLQREAGLRCWVRQGDGSAEVTLQFHHACCDGIGSLQFLADLLAAYGIRTASEGQRPNLPGCNPADLLWRGEHADAAAPPPKELNRSLLTDLRDIGRLLGRRPAILGLSGADAECSTPTIPFPGILRHEFDSAESARLHAAAAGQGVTVNDLLLRDMFLSLQTWIAERMSGSTGRWIRIAVPVSLRTGDGDCTSAANQVSYNLLTRNRHRCDESEEFLRGINLENQPSLRRRRGLMFLRGIRCLLRIPGAIPLYLGDHRCLATAVLSNLGDINRSIGAAFSCPAGKIAAGNLVLESILCAPPVRANTRAAFLVHKYAGRYNVCVRCDPQVFAEIDARRLLARYIEQMRRSI
ncbi:MAG: hypothetical protein IT426_02935 [Pirellulales bacterium]|nr:hypothetical protein [Pirellulales bacterium]